MSKKITYQSIITSIKSEWSRKRIIFPDINDHRVLEASEALLTEWQRPILIGYDSDFSLYRNTDFLSKNNYRENTDYYLIQDWENIIEHASSLLSEWKVDGLLWWNVSSTASIVRWLIKSIWTAQWIGRLSSYFVIENSKGLFFIADCAIQAEPNAQQLAEIAFLTAQSAAFYGIIPKIAMLSFSTNWSAKHPMVEKVQEATKIAEELLKQSDIQEYIIEWDIQLDAACKLGVWEKKNKDSKLKWEANILIFPDLDSGNIWYKAIDFFGDSIALWPILQWLKKPWNDLSRWCSVEEIVAMYYITAWQIQ